jgi:CIC family chloride channel protein
VNRRGHLWLLVFVTGALTGITGIGLLALLNVVEGRVWPHGSTLAGGFAAEPRLHRFGALLVAGLVTTAVRLSARRERASAGLLFGLWEQGGLVSLGRTVARSVLAVVDVGLGAALGREGPLKELGGALAAHFAVHAKLGLGRRRLLVACGTAAGFAAAYNVPLGGALFGLEVLLGRMEIELVGPMIVCCAVATTITRWLVGNEPNYHIPAFQFGGLAVLAGSLLFGGLLGAVSVLVIKGLRWFTKIEQRNVRLSPFMPLIALGSLGIASAWLPELMGNGYDVANAALHQELPASRLASLPVLRFIATAVCWAARVPGGLFTPVLSIGALIGGLVGKGVSYAWPSMHTGAFALLGMGALFAGATRGPISSVVIVSELSSNYELSLPLACACGVASLVSRRLERGSLYRLWQCRRPLAAQPLQPSIPVHPTRKVPVLTCASDLLPDLLTPDPRPLFVVDGCGRLEGALHPETARQRLAEESLPRLLIAGDLADRKCPRLLVHASLQETRAHFSGRDAPRFVPVVDDDGVLCGEARREDIVA